MAVTNNTNVHNRGDATGQRGDSMIDAAGAAEFRAAAKNCIDILATIPTLVEGDSDQPTAEYYRKRDAAITSLVEAAGPIPNQAYGVIYALAELVVSQEQDGVFHSLAGLNLEAVLTNDERMAARIKFAEDCGDHSHFIETCELA